MINESKQPDPRMIQATELSGTNLLKEPGGETNNIYKQMENLSRNTETTKKESRKWYK